MLEVLGPGRTAEGVVVVAGLGGSADWYKNVRANPSVEIAIGRERYPATSRTLAEDEAFAVLERYERRHRWIAPAVRRLLSRVVGWRYDGSANGRRRLVGQLPFVAFRPTAPAEQRTGQPIFRRSKRTATTRPAASQRDNTTR